MQLYRRCLRQPGDQVDHDPRTQGRVILVVVEPLLSTRREEAAIVLARGEIPTEQIRDDTFLTVLDHRKSGMAYDKDSDEHLERIDLSTQLIVDPQLHLVPGDGLDNKRFEIPRDQLRPELAHGGPCTVRMQISVTRTVVREQLPGGLRKLLYLAVGKRLGCRVGGIS